MDTTLFCSPSTPRQLGSIPAPRYGGNDSEDPELDAVDRSPRYALSVLPQHLAADAHGSRSSSGSPAWDALRPVVVAGGRVGAAAATAVVSAGSPFSYSALNSPAVSSTSPTSQTHGQSAHTAKYVHCPIFRRLSLHSSTALLTTGRISFKVSFTCRVQRRTPLAA